MLYFLTSHVTHLMQSQRVAELSGNLCGWVKKLCVYARSRKKEKVKIENEEN